MVYVMVRTIPLPAAGAASASAAACRVPLFFAVTSTSPVASRTSSDPGSPRYACTELPEKRAASARIAFPSPPSVPADA